MLAKLVIIFCLTHNINAENRKIKEQDDFHELLKSNRGINNRSTLILNGKQNEMQFTTSSMQYSNCSLYGDDFCPPWFYCDHTSSKCTCGQSIHQVIHCNETLQTSAVLDCYCVTYDESRNTTVAGACFYNCENMNNHHGLDVVYHTLPKYVSELQNFTCSKFNRAGPLCGRCENGSYPLAYSYNTSCIYKCSNVHKNWWKYILVAFVPLTFFSFLVLFFKIDANSSSLHGFVFFSQAVANPAFIRILLLAVKEHPLALIAVKVCGSLYGFWTLDFFRCFVPNICLKTSTLQTLALDYAVAVYPLLLMVVSYVLIELHDRNFRLIVFIWKPFRFVLSIFRRNWDSRTSVIDAYATFFMLSFIKFLSVSSDILTPAHLHVLNSKQSILVLYFDGSIEFFGRSHLPFAILAIIVIFVFIILPIAILFLYPFKFFQKFLGCFPNKIRNILRTFVDSFIGCYKDGTEPGTRDCRWFAVLFLLWRILAEVIYAVTLGSAFFPGALLLLLILAILMIIVKPFKATATHFTTTNLTFIILLALWYSLLMGLDVSSIKAIRFYNTYLAISIVVGITPLIYISCIVIHWLFAQRKWGKNLISKFQAWRQGYDWLTYETDVIDDNSLPDRMVNPDQYHEGNLSNFPKTTRAKDDAHTLDKRNTY